MTRRNPKFKMEEGKLMMGTHQPIPRKDIGKCPLCFQAVYASEGQATVHLNGNPTHKRCRKAR